MRRRNLLAILAGAGAVSWPLVLSAQQANRVRRIGVMMVNAESDPEGRIRIAAFQRGLEALGWVEGVTTIDGGDGAAAVQALLDS